MKNETMAFRARTDEALISILSELNGIGTIKGNFRFYCRAEQNAVINTICCFLKINSNEALVHSKGKKYGLVYAGDIVRDFLIS